ncbi:MAG TPA: helix-turn-helix transcriptional regulator [Mycobacteriales bacterium]|nr:helix-turn-helix transcriptional regulator [Mycobacteriales bacterium]
MTSQPSDPGPILRRRQLGARLRQLREAAGKTLDEVADYLECSTAKVSRVETGRMVARTPDVRHMLTLYRVAEPLATDLLDQVRTAQQPGWWAEYAHVMPPGMDTYVGLVDATTGIDWYEATLIPGLLQTRDYLHAVLAPRPDLPDEEVDQFIDLRMRLNEVLTRAEPPPPRLHAVIDEAALRRGPDSPMVMRDQLHHLVEMAALPHITIQVLPFSAGFSASNVSFYAFTLPDPATPITVGIEQLAGVRYESKREQVGRFTLAFDSLRTDALDPERSIAFLTELAGNLDAPSAGQGP